MAKYGLEFGSRVEVAGGKYALLDGAQVSNLKEVLSGYKFAKATNIMGMMPDPSNPRNEIPSGEVLGAEVGLRKKGHGTIFVTIPGMSAGEVESRVAFMEEVELLESAVSLLGFEDNQVKFFANDIVKKGQNQQQQKQGKDKQDHQG